MELNEAINEAKQLKNRYKAFERLEELLLYVASLKGNIHDLEEQRKALSERVELLGEAREEAAQKRDEVVRAAQEAVQTAQVERDARLQEMRAEHDTKLAELRETYEKERAEKEAAIERLDKGLLALRTQITEAEEKLARIQSATWNKKKELQSLLEGFN